MNPARHIARLGAAILSVAAILVSCERYKYLEGDPSSEDDWRYGLNIELSLPAVYGTRADYSYADAGDWENYIDCDGDLHFYFFDSSNKYLTHIPPEDMIVIRHEESGVSHFRRYTVHGRLDNPPSSGFKLMVLANCGRDSYPEEVTVGEDRKLRLGDGTLVDDIDGLCSALTYELGPITQLGNDCLIPMFGLSTLSALSFEKGRNTNLGEVFLLRALAKVEVCVASEEVGDLQNVVLHNYNTKGLCAPVKVYSRDDYMLGGGTDAEADFLRHVSIPSGLTAGSAFSLAHNGKTVRYTAAGDPPYVDRHVFTAYVPEYRNLKANPSTGLPLSPRQLETGASYMTLTFGDGDMREFRLDFKDYDTDEPFDIQRNNYYRYTVKRGSIGLFVTVEVAPYIPVVLNPTFGSDLPRINMQNSYVHMYESSVYEFSIDVLFYHPEGGEVLTLTTSNPAVTPTVSIINVSDDGMSATGRVVCGNTFGEATITASYGTVSSTCTIVSGPQRLVLDNYWLDVAIGGKKSILATICADHPSDAAVSWSVANESSPGIISLDVNGNAVAVNALSSGEADVVATYVRALGGGGSQTITAICHVVAGTAGITIDSGDFDLALSGTKTMSAALWPYDYVLAPIRWTSADPSIASVTPDGKVTGNGRGTTVLTASCGDLSSSCTVKVMRESISLNHETLTIKKGFTGEIVATVTPEGNNLDVVWTSLDRSKVTVINGTVYGVAVTTSEVEIKAKITRPDGTSTSKKCKVTVVD